MIRRKRLSPTMTLVSASTVAIRPRETEPIVDESLNLAADVTTLHVNYEARTTPGIPGAYRIDLSVPSELSIDEIAVTEADRSVRCVEPNAKNRVSVFFDQQISKPYRLVLTGTTSVDANGKAPLPHVSTLATEDATQKIRVYRNEDVHVEFEGLASTTDPKTDVPPGPPPSQWTARPLATCYLQSGSATAQIIVRPNKSKIIGDALTVLTRENGAGGELPLPTLGRRRRIERPAAANPKHLRRPVRSSIGDAGHDCSQIARQPNQHLVRSFATSVAKGGSLDMRIRSPLKPPTGTGVTARQL